MSQWAGRAGARPAQWASEPKRAGRRSSRELCLGGPWISGSQHYIYRATLLHGSMVRLTQATCPMCAPEHKRRGAMGEVASASGKGDPSPSSNFSILPYKHLSHDPLEPVTASPWATGAV